MSDRTPTEITEVSERLARRLRGVVNVLPIPSRMLKLGPRLARGGTTSTDTSNTQ